MNTLNAILKKASLAQSLNWQQMLHTMQTLFSRLSASDWKTGVWINLPLLVLAYLCLNPWLDAGQAIFMCLAYLWAVVLWAVRPRTDLKSQVTASGTSAEEGKEKSLHLLQEIDQQCLLNLERVSNMSGEAMLNMLERAHNVHTQSEKVVGYLSSSGKQSAQIQEVIEKNTKLIDFIYNFIRGLENTVAEEKQRSAQLMAEVKQFSQMTTVIRSIARQTEILAINARIEAARAGDAGHGFGVLAAEVRRLSIQSNETAVRIDQDINRLQQAVQSQMANENLVEQIHSHEFGAENILELTKELSDSYLDIRDFYQILISSITQHNIRLNEDIQALLDLGQYQDVFKQVIDRLCLVITERQSCVVELVQNIATDGSGGLQQVVAHLKSMIANYSDTEANHGDFGSLQDKKTAATLDRIELF